MFLALSGLFPETIEPIRAAFEGLIPQEHIRVWYAPGPVREVDSGNAWQREVAELIREAFLASLRPDVIHICSMFEGYLDDAVTSIGRFDKITPVSVSLYDLIPLLNPDQYLKPDPSYRVFYERKVGYLQRASLLLAISDFSRQEGVRHLLTLFQITLLTSRPPSKTASIHSRLMKLEPPHSRRNSTSPGLLSFTPVVRTNGKTYIASSWPLPAFLPTCAKRINLYWQEKFAKGNLRKCALLP